MFRTHKTSAKIVFFNFRFKRYQSIKRKNTDTCTKIKVQRASDCGPSCGGGGRLLQQEF